MSWFSVFRILLLGLVWAMSIIVLGIAANNIALSVGSVWLYPNLALAVSITTHAMATPMLVISLAKKGAYTSRVIIELSWAGVLWMLWLASAVVTTSTPVFSPSCEDYQDFYGEELGAECTQFTVLQALTWLITSLLLFYSVTLFTLALLTNLWHNTSTSTPTSDEKGSTRINAFFTDAASLHFLWSSNPSSTTRPSENAKRARLVLDSPKQLPRVAILPERRDSKYAPQFESGTAAQQFWDTISLKDEKPSTAMTTTRLERGRSTSTLGSSTAHSTYKNYVPSPLSVSAMSAPGTGVLAPPHRALLPSQSPYLATKKASAASDMFDREKGMV
ncbi:hypothetical protein M408DRAFT_9430 [Serendipita vermifera MAFF 305830]|uniref:MARVEL domain-containing protein n=1 Tax=Serendipita vermifera MAFF 305830 TaxID=933852 RepID=A0A0C3B718_SERVB|nr:hypothetical protein M408DRAFT_9430 [Serendipita vermifera MAFF 305830]